MDSILEIRNLSKSFGQLKAVDDLSLTVHPGEIFALLGPNGAGKTTLIGCITGLIEAFNGSIHVGGHDVRREYPLVRQLVGLVPQELNFDGYFKARHILEYQCGYFGVRNYRERARELLEIFALSDKAESNSRWLSGGMKRRLMICKALVHKPALLFLDEPTAGVDVELRDEMWAYVRKLREAGTTIVLTTHYLEEAEMLADRIGVIDHGKLVLLERRDDLLNRYGERWLEITFDRPVDPAVFREAGCTHVDPAGGNTLRFRFKDTAGVETADDGPLPAILGIIRREGLTALRIDGGRSRLEEIFRDVVGNGRNGSGEVEHAAN